MMTIPGAAGNKEQAISERPGWLIPLVVFVLVLLLSGVVLLYYLAPRPTAFIQEHPSATATTDRVMLSVGGIKFQVPANYIRYRSVRRGGILQQVPLFAALPDFRGYDEAEAPAFLGNVGDSPVVYILLHEEPLKLSEGERLRRIYFGHLRDTRGHAAPFGLTLYSFKDDSGYRGEDLLVGRFGTGMVVLRCERASPNVFSPSCLRDTRLARRVYLSYRFKRSQLGRWREISSGVESLVRSFMRGA